MPVSRAQLHKPTPRSRGYALAAARLINMSEDEMLALTSERLVASYGVRPDEADQLIRSFQRRF